jgi:rhamnose transport system ATP-binding protein
MTAGGPTRPSPPALLLEDVSKTYPGTRALDGVSLSVGRGEFRALVGENGSGKSTLVGILGGRVAADPGGRVEVCGAALPQHDPSASRALGVAIIHQELLIVPQLSAVENVFLGDLPRRGGLVDFDRMRGEFRVLAGRLGITIDPGTPAGTLSIAQQTLLEIMRAMRRQARVLIMDEPTVTLGVPERERLYAIIESLKADAVTFLLISHDLDEVMRLADSVTVFRDGHHVRTAPRPGWSKAGLVDAMLGDERGAKALAAGQRPDDLATGAPLAQGPPLMRVRGVRAGAKLAVDELSVASGEIVGIAGLVGSGRTSLLRALAGAFEGSAGELQIDGKAVRWPRRVQEALGRGIALLPEDRKRHGLVLDLPAGDNVTLSDLGAVSSHGVLSRPRGLARARKLLADVEFRGRIEGPARTLSGGNQQKVMVAKWVHAGPRILLIDEPTRGIDIGAKQDMMRAIQELAARGHGIVWVSSELEEVVAVSHRVVVMSRGRTVGELAGNDITLGRVLDTIFDSAADPRSEAGPGTGAVAVPA